MLLNLTLDPAVDTAADARRSIALIALAFSLDSYSAPGETVVDSDLDAAAIFGGQTTTPDRTVVTRDPGTGALQAHTIPGVEIDKDGLPWDARIHSAGTGGGSKPKNQDGRWKRKRGVEDSEVARVEAELRSIMSIPGPASVAAPDAVNAHVPASTAVPPPPPPVVTVTETAAVPPPPPPVEVAEPMTFPKLMAWVGPHMAAGRLTAATVATTMQALGIVDGKGDGSLALLATRPDLVPGAYGSLVAIVGAA
jgi:hypothetical protein